ncbi:hypothetical protein [Rhizobium leguminosarum]|uniref:hypothetical protein n=1 Tax=Rhizobium leguminosarum TaxID=384 RepID=UPI002E136B1A|nr:hypothetical protein U8Q02_39240 [Rhizobium leguminosarum]
MIDDGSPYLHDPSEFDLEARASARLFMIKFAFIIGLALTPLAGLAITGASII